MLESEKMAIAAHLHVLMRRKIGRVTDVEWMVKNRDYALEVIRIARAEPHDDVREWAHKLEAAVFGVPAAQPPVRNLPTPLPAYRDSQLSAPMPLDGLGGQRYVGRLR